VFNLAALPGLATVVAGRIGFHRRVVVLAAVVAVGMTAAVGAAASGASVPDRGRIS
jgi:hypothetical protein